MILSVQTLKAIKKMSKKILFLSAALIIGVSFFMEAKFELVADVSAIASATSTQPSITVLSPNGGESWVAGQSYTVRWTSSGIPQDVPIGLSLLDTGKILGYAWTVTAPQNTGEYNFAVPTSAYAGASYEMLVSVCKLIDGSTVCSDGRNPYWNVIDRSDSHFTVTAPTVQKFSASCSGTASNSVKPLVNWQAQVSGGSEPYTYSWSIYNDVSSYGDGSTHSNAVTVNYSSAGAKEAVIIVVDKAGNKTSATCQATIPVSSAQPSITVLSPNGGEKYQVGDTVNITWNALNVPAETNLGLQLSYNLNGRTFEDGIASSNLSPDLKGGYSWVIPTQYGGNGMNSNLFKMRAFLSGPNISNVRTLSDYSDSYFTIIASPQPSLAASLLNSFEDRAGLWQNFGPGAGNINKNSADWNWKATLTLPSQKTIARMTIAHNNNGEVWSTGYSRYLKNGTDLYGYEEHPYPLVVVSGKQQLNSSYDQELGAYGAGTNSTFILYGQPESAQFIGGKLIVEFTDGTIVPAPIMASNYRPSVATPGGTVPIEVKEQVKCVFKFKGTASEQKCYTAGDNSRAVCTGTESCVADISGSAGEKITWKSSCGGYAYTVLDGSNKYAIFYCAESESAATPTVAQSASEQILDINEKSKLLSYNNFDFILAELNQLRSIIKEQQTQIKYLSSLVRDVKNLSQKTQDALNNFITYGVDANTEKLGAGERAAVINSYKAAFDKLPETEAELADAIKIANGRFPSVTSADAERTAKEQFVKIYKRAADLNDANDNAAIKVMAYGLRQKAENRNLLSERAGIRIFKAIYGRVPSSTEDWNIMQAITYSGASREKVYTNNQYGFEFKYPPTWSLVIDSKASLSDYLPAEGSRSFVAIYPTENRQDFSARVDVYNSPLTTVKRDNPFIQNITSVSTTINGISWTKMGATDYLVEENGKTYHVSGQADLSSQVVSTFKFTK